MSKRSLRAQAVLFALLISSSSGTAAAAALPVFLWVASATGVTGYDTNGATVVSLPTPGLNGWGLPFSVSTFGTSLNNQFVVVSDSLKHSLTEYSYNGSTNAVAQVGTTFNFPADPFGDNSNNGISPQEIATDSNGNLWTTSAGGAVTEWCGKSPTCTLNGTTFNAGSAMQTVTVPSADGAPRGIMINAANATIYVTTSGYGIGNGTTPGIYKFTVDAATGLAGSLSTYVTLQSATVSGIETGQLRGITYDTGGNIYWGDSSWGQFTGYIDLNTNTTTPFASGLAGPNAMESGPGTGHGQNGANCDQIYIANYFGGTIVEQQTGLKMNGSASGCATTNSSPLVFLTGLTNPTGLAIAFGEGALGGSIATPSGLFEAVVDDTPEPGTWILTLSLLAVMGALQAGRCHKGKKPQP